MYFKQPLKLEAQIVAESIQELPRETSSLRKHYNQDLSIEDIHLIGKEVKRAQI